MPDHSILELVQEKKTRQRSTAKQERYSDNVYQEYMSETSDTVEWFATEMN